MNKKYFLNKSAYTLSEILLSVAVLAVLVAMIVPILKQASPNEDEILFLKSFEAIHTGVSKLVNDEEYYTDGKLDTVNGLNDFCSNLSKVLYTNTTNSCQNVVLKNGTVIKSITAENRVFKIELSTGEKDNKGNDNIHYIYIRNDGRIYVDKDSVAYEYLKAR